MSGPHIKAGFEETENVVQRGNCQNPHLIGVLHSNGTGLEPF